MLAAPHDAERLGDLDQWWVERRLIARKLLDLGDCKAAYAVANGGAAPINENYRAEQQFTAGWIALRFLREPAVALGALRPHRRGRHQPDHAGALVLLAGPRCGSARARTGGARRITKRRRAIRPPITASSRARGWASTPSRCALRRSRAPNTTGSKSRAPSKFSTRIDERDLVADMAADLGDKSTDVAALAALAEIATRHNDARATLLIGKPALSHGLPLEHYAFPDFGVPNYQQIGPEVERCVVYSIVRQESAFNSRVVSSANAIGLMQVTPAAGRDTAKRFNVSFDQHRLMADVAYNAQLGTAELGNDIATWRGSYILAFVAYNAGPRRAKEWIEQYGDPRNPKVDPIDWIERIPISETRNYVQRVIENMQVYRARLGNDPRLLIEADLRRGG